MISPILLCDFYLSLSPVVYSLEDRNILAKHRLGIKKWRKKTPTDPNTPQTVLSS